MNGERPTVNGAHIANGIHNTSTESPSNVGPTKQPSQPQNPPLLPLPPSISHALEAANGDVGSSQRPTAEMGEDAAGASRDQAPTEILRLISQESYLPMATLISRMSQSCWNGLSDLVEQLASISVPVLPPEQARLMPNGLPNNQSKSNLDKKDLLFNFANGRKAEFVKLLVLLQWSKNVDEVSKTISLNFWLMTRRRAYWETIGSLALLKQESPGFQIPNPDLRTAAEVLSRGRVNEFPRLGYIVTKDLSSRQIVRVLKSLNCVLSVKLALSEDLPYQLRTFKVHDGRATFSVPDEFEVDLSSLNESLESPFRMVDFRFAFQPSPQVPDRLQSEIEHLANSNIDQGGLTRCYEFLHELTLSYKLAEFHKQAIALSRNQWAGNLRVELLRRNLIVQYWSERQLGKSWVEVSIASGRRKQNFQEQEPHSVLDVKCTWHGKRMEASQIHLDEAVLSFEDILRQVVAQHSTQILDSIYDKLVLSRLFADGELSLEQSLSYEDPEECALVMQTSSSSQLELKVDSVTGLIMMSPVTERTERLQFEVNRVQALADEVASKLLNFRCSVMESTVLAGVAGTKWETLRSFRFTQAEIKSLFGRQVVRMNMFRQSQWALEYSLAITHGQDGDHWWLLQQTSVGANSLARYKVLRTQRIEIKDELSSAYFDRLADYSIGLICLQCNADFFSEKKEPFDLRPFPAFGLHYELPEFVFGLDLARPAFAREFPPQGPSAGLPFEQEADTPATKTPSLQRKIRVRFGGVDRSGNKITTIGQYQNQASSSVLRRLDKSVFDENVNLNSDDQMVTIRVETSMTDAAITSIVAKVLDLEKVISTVEQIHRLPGLKLTTIANSKISLIYHNETSAELGLNITFTSGSPAPHLEFFPTETNPHQILSKAYTRSFTASRGPFTETMRDILTSLTATLPLLTFLHKLQHKQDPSDKAAQQTIVTDREDHVRVHVFPRDATWFAVHYFTWSGFAAKESIGDSQRRLLARLEIESHVKDGKPGWLLRPALEEFQSYSRASYSSPELGAKLKQEIFSHRTDRKTKWRTLDRGAWCTVDQPEPLLQAAHDVLRDWAKQGKSASSTSVNAQDSNKTKVSGANPTANNSNLQNGINNRSGPTKAPPGRLQTTNNTAPNGANAKAQRPNPNAPGGRALAGIAKMNAKSLQNKEVITLD